MKGDIVLIPLYSSSEGNSTLVQVNGHSILIDLGKNCKQCTIALQKAGVYADDIEAVFLIGFTLAQFLKLSLHINILAILNSVCFNFAV